MFGRKKMKDERITNAQNKVYREIYTIVAVICIGSIIFKSFTTDGSNFGVIATELIILFSTGLYYLWRTAKMGIFSEEIEISDKNSKFSYDTRNVVMGVLSGLVLAVFLGLKSSINYAEGTLQSLYNFGLVFVVTLLFYVPFLLFILIVPYKIAQKKSEQVNRKLLEQMDDDE